MSAAASLRCVLPALTLATAAPASASEFPIRSLEKPFFLVDAVALPAGPDSARVDLTWEVPYRELVFRREGEYYRARYDVGVVFARGNEQVFGTIWDRRARTRSFAETRDAAQRSKGRKIVRLPAGRYEVRITMTDRTSLATSFAAGEIDADFGDSRIGLSDLRFVRYTEDDEEIPNPGREVPVGEPGHFVCLTLHPEGETGGVYLVKWRYETTHRKRVAEGDTSVVVAGEPLRLEIPVPSDRFTAGVYRLEVGLEGSDGGSREERSTMILARLTPGWFVTHRDEALEVFRVIATPEEFEPLDEAAEGTWAERVQEFWAGRDPSPDSPGNDFREEIQSRMETAATWFDEPFRHPGWKTDRGRVLLRWGPPDRRTVTEADFEGPARELWEYDSPRQVFVFVDERGAGEYWLRS